MKYETLETIHELLQKNERTTCKACGLLRSAYYEAQNTLDDAGESATEKIRTRVQETLNRYDSMREKWRKANAALEDFMGHDFN